MSRLRRRRFEHPGDQALGAGPHEEHPRARPGDMPADLAALRADLAGAIRRDHRRGLARRRTARIGLIGVACALALSGSALAAGAALGVINLGGGVTAKRIAKVPSPQGSGEIALGYVGCYHHDCSAKPRYVYQLSGGRARRSFGGITCGPQAAPFRPRRIFVTSHVPLSHAQLRYAVGGILGGNAGRRVRVPQGTMTIVRICHETPLKSGKLWRRRGHARGLPPDPQRGGMREVGVSPLPVPVRPFGRPGVPLHRAARRPAGRRSARGRHR